MCLTGLPRIAALLHVLRAERGPSPVLALAIVEVCSPHALFQQTRVSCNAIFYALRTDLCGSLC